jgi:hypothetical protein
MGTDLQVTGVPGARLADVLALADHFNRSGMFSGVGVSGAVVKILAGRELGFGPFASMTGVHVIEGRPSLGSHLMAAKIKSSGRYDYRVNRLDDEECSLTFLERADGQTRELGTERVTIQEAHEKKWHLTRKNEEKSPWVKSPRNMLFARCMSNGFKFYCPDLLAGSVAYHPDEFDAEEPAEDVPPLPGTVVQVDATVDPPLSQPEPRQTEAVEVITAGQRAELVDLLKQFGDRKDEGRRLLDDLYARYQVAKLGDIPAVHFDDCKRFIADRLAALSAAEQPVPPVTQEQFKAELEPTLRARPGYAAELLKVLGVARLGEIPQTWLPLVKAVFARYDQAAALPLFARDYLDGKTVKDLDLLARSLLLQKIG